MSKARDIADLDFNSPDIDGGNIDGATIGATTPAGGTFTNGTVSGSLALSSDSSQLQLGTGNRAQIFHNSNALYLRSSTGGILVQGPSLSHYSSDASTLYFSAASGGLSFGGTNFLTSARNLQNIGTISSSGTATFGGQVNAVGVDSTGVIKTSVSSGEAQIQLENTGGTANLSYLFNSTSGFGRYNSTGTHFYDHYDRSTNQWNFYNGTNHTVLFHNGTFQIRSASNTNAEHKLIAPTYDTLETKVSSSEATIRTISTTPLKLGSNNQNTLTLGASHLASFTAGLTVNNTISARSDADVATQGAPQLSCIDNTNGNLRLNVLCDTAVGANGGIIFQGTESGVSNDRDIRIQTYGGRATVGLSKDFAIGSQALTTTTFRATSQSDLDGRVNFGNVLIGTLAGGYMQVSGSSGNAWAMGATGGNNTPGVASTTLAFHHWNGSAWNNELELDSSGNLIIEGNFSPMVTNTQDLGSSNYRWRNAYIGDLELSNEGHENGNEIDGTKGNWTIQEGEEHLYLINNKNGKKFKFALEEVS